MNTSLLVNLIGFPATLLHGDTLMLDRWIWLRERLPSTKNGEKLIDIGCGTGAFSIGASLKGYETLGLSWDERNQNVAAKRAEICGARSSRFEVLDVRRLDERRDLVEVYDVAICFENVEHIIDDAKLIKDISAVLKPGGRLLLTTPNYFYRAITRDDERSSTTEDGGHVRRGYTPAMLEELCDNAHLKIERISYCSGFCSQKITFIMRVLHRVHPLLGWLAVLPLRVLPPVCDRALGVLSGWPNFSICIEAYKPKLRER